MILTTHVSIECTFLTSQPPQLYKGKVYIYPPQVRLFIVCRQSKRQKTCTDLGGRKVEMYRFYILTPYNGRCCQLSKITHIHIYTRSKKFSVKIKSASRDGPEKSTEKGTDENTGRLSCCRKVVVKKDWNTTSVAKIKSGNRSSSFRVTSVSVRKMLYQKVVALSVWTHNSPIVSHIQY